MMIRDCKLLIELHYIHVAQMLIIITSENKTTKYKVALYSVYSFAYKYNLSISGWLFIKFNNAFVFPDLEPPIINILHEILIKGGSRSGKINALLNLINNQPDIDTIYLYEKDLYEAKYQYLVKKREKVGWNYYDDPEAFIEYSNDVQDFIKILKNTI